ncbi:MAG: class I SAM-dependent methyltransferase [Candidatus Nanoarchaeia archaeon]
MAEHYFSEKQESSNERFLIEIKLKNDSFSLLSSSGLFSKNELDTATKLLIEKAEIKNEEGKVLDLGCGYGVVGISVLRKYKKMNVVFSDVNERALELTKENLMRLKLKGKVLKSDLYSKIEEKFDIIISNPPYAAGREVCFKLIEESFEHLEKNGTLQIVARHNKGGKVLSEKMKEVFGNLETTAKSGGFHVYLSRR